MSTRTTRANRRRTWQRFCARRRGRLQPRTLRIEHLEDRHMLSLGCWPIPAWGDAPPLFVAGQGPWADAGYQLVRHGGNGTVGLKDSSLIFQFAQEAPFQDGVVIMSTLGKPGGTLAPPASDQPLQTITFGLEFVGASAVNPQGLEPAPTVFHYLVGPPQNWQLGVPSYRSAVYDNLYPGVDLVLEGSPGGVCFRLIVPAGTDPSQLEFQWQGIETISLDQNGHLILTLPDATTVLWQPLPRFYQLVDDQEVELSGHYQLLDEDSFTLGVDLIPYPEVAVVIEGQWGWLFYLPSEPGEEPPEPGEGEPPQGEPAGQTGEVFATFALCENSEPSEDWGVPGDEHIGDGEGEIGIFPLFDPERWHLFLAQVSPEGVVRGGAIFPIGGWIAYPFWAFDQAGNFVLVGSVPSAVNPPSLTDGQWLDRDVCVVKFDAEGMPLWCAFLGGASNDWGHSVAIDSDGTIYLAGSTWSTDWVFGGEDTSWNGEADGFVARLSPEGVPSWSTYLGGDASDHALGITIDPQGTVIVTGQSASAGWVNGGSETELRGPSDAFVAKFDPNGAHVWSTYLGGDGDDLGFLVGTDAEGTIWVLGETSTTDWLAGGEELPWVQDMAGILAQAFASVLNDPPTLVVTPAVDIIPEDANTSERIRLADVLVSDDGLGTVRLSLTGPDAELMEIEPTEGIGSFSASLYLRAGTLLDPVNNPILEVTIEADDPELGTGPEATHTLNIPVAHVLSGTSVSDWFQFRSAPGGLWKAIVNGKEVIFGPEAAAVVFRGGGGIDRAIVYDSPAGDEITVSAEKVLAYFRVGMQLHLYGCEQVDVQAGAAGEPDTLVLQLWSSGSTTLDISPSHVTWRGPGAFTFRGFNFAGIRANGQAATGDVARLWMARTEVSLNGSLEYLELLVGAARPSSNNQPDGDGQIRQPLSYAVLEGFDRVNVFAGPGIDQAEISDGGPGQTNGFVYRAARGEATFSNWQRKVRLYGFEELRVLASDLADRAAVVGSGSGETFTFRAEDGYAEFVTDPFFGSPVSIRTQGFGTVLAFSSGRGQSSARFFDSDQTADRFWAGPNWAALRAGDYYARAFTFDAYEAFFTGGGTGDVVTLYDSPLTGDRLVSHSNQAVLTFGATSHKYVSVTGYRWLKSYASGALFGEDTALIVLPAGSNQEVRASFWNPQVVAENQSYYVYVKNFRRISVIGNGEDDDTARVWDSPGNEHVSADGALNPSRAVVSNPSFLLELNDLAVVRVFGQAGGDNTKEIRNPELLDFVLETVGSWREV
ncbi:MAG: SBBP repeat-containing protein [Thermoguttaceae bacterium]|nr:SBBP repeat-containing protein [Thermoguttaceae bacterium]